MESICLGASAVGPCCCVCRLAAGSGVTGAGAWWGGRGAVRGYAGEAHDFTKGVPYKELTVGEGRALLWGLHSQHLGQQCHRLGVRGEG